MATPAVTGTPDVWTTYQGGGNYTNAIGARSVTVASDAEIIVLAMHEAYPGDNVGTVSATFSGSAMTSLGTSTDGATQSTRGCVFAFYLKSGDTGFGTGSQTIDFSSTNNFNGGTNMCAVLATYKQVDLTTPFGTVVTATGDSTTNSTLSISGATTNDLVLDFLSIQRSTGASTITETGNARGTYTGSVDGTAFLDSELRQSHSTGTGSAFAATWTLLTRGWCQLGVPLKGTAAGSTINDHNFRGSNRGMGLGAGRGLSFHQHPQISLSAYYRERAIAQREFLEKVRRAA